MRTISTVAVIVAMALTLVAADAMAASSSVWFASKKQIARELTYHWTTSDNVRVRISQCQGMGPSVTKGGSSCTTASPAPSWTG
jgi:hypothetical protein